MKRNLISLALAVCLCLALAVTAFAESSLPRLVDNADLLSESEEQALLSKLDSISQKHQLDVVVVTTDTLDGKSAMAYADDFFDYNGYGFGDDGDGILLLVSMGTREWHMSTKGYGITAFTDAGLDHMADQFLTDLSDGYYYDAFVTYADLCDDFIAQANAGTPYDYNTLPKEPFHFGASLLISVVIGFVIALVSTGAMKSELNSVRRQPRADHYVRNNSLDINLSQDFYLYRQVSRTVKSQETGSGGSSVHRSSSGSMHGGRGGRF